METYGFGFAELIILLPLLLVLILHIYLILRMLSSETLSFNMKALWLVILVFVPVLGAIIYLFTQYRVDTKQK